MLFTANKAWINIVTKQLENGTIGSAMIVAKDLYELAEFLGCSGDTYVPLPFKVMTERSATKMMQDDTMDMYDEILISHDIYNCFLKDYLSRHCNRIMNRRKKNEQKVTCSR